MINQRNQTPTIASFKQMKMRLEPRSIIDQITMAQVDISMSDDNNPGVYEVQS